MARQPKPWYRKDRNAWFITIEGVRHNLGSNKKSALKRASLQRQLAGVEPYYVQDIMEQALEQWLKEHGYVN